MNLPSIETSRLRLRTLTDGDLDSLFAIFSDVEVMRYWSSEPMASVEDARILLEHISSGFESKSLYQWGVARRDDDRVIGTCTLFNIDLRNRRAEVGYALTSSEWGRGLASEAVSALIGHAFEAHDLIRIEADVDPNNHSSLKLLGKLGFVREGFARERWVVGGRFFDSVLLGLLRRDFNPI